MRTAIITSITTLLIAISHTFLLAQTAEFYQTEMIELTREKRDIQQLRYNQDKVNTRTRDGKSILLVDKLDYGVTSQGFKLMKFKDNGEADLSFGTKGVAQQNLPLAIYRATDIVEAANGDIFVAGAQSRTPQGVMGNSIIVKYDAKGVADTLFGTDGDAKGFFSRDFGVMLDLDAVKIKLTADNKIIMVNKTIGNDYAPKTTLVRLDYDGGFVRLGYYNSKLHGAQEYITDIPGVFNMVSCAVLANKKTVVCGTYVDDIHKYKHQIGFIVRYNENLRLDSSFANNGVLRINIDTARESVINHIADLPNGQLMVLGSIHNNRSTGSSAQSKFFMQRIYANGAIDPRFGENGIAYFEEKNKQNYGEYIAVLNDGNFLVAYHSNTEPNNFLHKWFALFDANGRLVVKTKKIDLYPYQYYTHWNFPYYAMFQKIIAAYK